MINSIGTAISDLLTSFGILKDDGAEDAEEALASVSEPLEGMSDTISNIGDAIGEFASFIGEKLSNINIGAVAGVVAVVLLVVEAIKSLKSIANIGKTIGTVGDTLSTFLDGTGEAISAFQKDAKADAFKKNVEAVAIGIGTLVAAVAILGNMDTGDMIQGIGGLTVIVVGVIALMYQFEHMDATKVSSATQTIKAIGTALLEISASVAIMVLAIEELNKFVQDIHLETVIALAGIIAAILVAIWAINKTSGGSGASGAASNFAGAAEIVAFAAAVLIIAQAIKSLTKVADDINAAVVIAIVAAMAGIITAIAVINKTGAGSTNSSTGKIIAMAAEILAFAEAVNMVVSAIKKLANLGDQLNPGVVITVVAVMAAIALAMMGINTFSSTGSAGKVVALAAEILSFSVAVKIVADAIKDLAELGDQLNPGVVVTVVALIAAIALALMGINTFSGTGGVGKILSLSAEILALSAAIGIMAAAVAGLAQIDSGAMDGALKAILELTVAVDAMMVVSNFAGEESKILSMAVLIAAIAGSMALLAVVDPNSLSGAADAMIEMSLVFSLMSVASNAADVGSIAGLTVGIAALALILGLLATCTEGKDLVGAAAGLLLASTVFVVLGTVFGILSGLGITIDLGSVASISAGVAMLAVILGLLSNFTDSGDLVATAAGLVLAGAAFAELGIVFAILGVTGGSIDLGSIASISAGVAMLALVLGLLSNLTDAGDLVATSMALSTMLPMVSLLAVVFGALSALNISIDLGSVAAISVAIGAIALILGALSNLTDAGDLMATSMALNMILPIITQVVTVFGVISTLMGLTGFGGVAAGLTGLLGIIAILAAVIAALGAVSQSEFASSLVTGAFSLIGEAIGDFIGSMQNAILGKSLEGMTEMMEEFGGSMDELKQFSNDISEIDTGAFDNLDSITGAFLKLTAADFLQGISSFVGGSGDFSSFADGISTLADAIVTYADKMAGVDQGALAQANENVAALIDLQETLPKVGGIAQMFTGEYDWSSLYTGLAEMGQGLADFSAAVSGETFDSTAISSAIECLGSLAEAQGKIEASGGVLQDLVGTSDWATLGTGLAEMGGALASFSESIADLNADDITNINTAIEAITALASAQTEIEDTGGFLQSLFGSSNWSTLTDGLTDLGTALAGFSSAITSEGSFDSGSVESGVQAIEKLAELDGATLGDTSGLNWMKDNLGDFGQSLADFNGSIAGLTWPDNLGELASIIEAIGSASESVSGGFLSGGSNLPGVLDEVGPSLADFCKKMNNVEIPDMTSVAEMVESIGSASESVKGMDTSQLSTIFSNTGTELVSFVTDMQGVTIPDLSELVSMMDSIAKASKSVAGMETTQLSEIVGNVKESLEGFGDITMPDNASEIAAMIESIGTACTAAEGVSTGDLSTMLTTVSTTLASFDGIEIPDIVTDLAGFVESFTSITWPSDMSDMENCFESIKKVCTDFDGVTIPTADSLSGFASGLSSNLSSAGEDGAKALVEALNGSSGDMTSAGETLTSAVADGITSSESVMTDAATSLCKAVVTTFGNSESDFTTCGKGVVSAVASGMGDTSKISAAAMSMVNQAVSTLNTGYNSFYGAGQYNAEGFRQGILSKAGEIAQAAAKVVTDAISAANAAQDSASPSKVMTQSGEWFDQGYINGIVKLIPYVEKAAANMVDEAVDTVASESANLSSVLEDEMNFNPVITPVLDLSQVEAGAASVNEMFLNTPTMRVNTEQVTGAFGAMSNFQNGQRNPNADLLSAIKGLDERLGSVRGNTYNVNGVTYDDGTNVADAIGQLMHAAKIERRV